jgi:hypothetical protein
MDGHFSINDLEGGTRYEYESFNDDHDSKPSFLGHFSAGVSAVKARIRGYEPLAGVEEGLGPKKDAKRSSLLERLDSQSDSDSECELMEIIDDESDSFDEVVRDVMLALDLSESEDLTDSTFAGVIVETSSDDVDSTVADGATEKDIGVGELLGFADGSSLSVTPAFEALIEAHNDKCRNYKTNPHNCISKSKDPNALYNHFIQVGKSNKRSKKGKGTKITAKQHNLCNLGGDERKMRIAYMEEMLTSHGIEPIRRPRKNSRNSQSENDEKQSGDEGNLLNHMMAERVGQLEQATFERTTGAVRAHDEHAQTAKKKQHPSSCDACRRYGGDYEVLKTIPECRELLEEHDDHICTAMHAGLAASLYNRFCPQNTPDTLPMGMFARLISGDNFSFASLIEMYHVDNFEDPNFPREPISFVEQLPIRVLHEVGLQISPLVIITVLLTLAFSAFMLYNEINWSYLAALWLIYSIAVGLSYFISLEYYMPLTRGGDRVLMPFWFRLSHLLVHMAEIKKETYVEHTLRVDRPGLYKPTHSTPTPLLSGTLRKYSRMARVRKTSVFLLDDPYGHSYNIDSIAGFKLPSLRGYFMRTAIKKRRVRLLLGLFGFQVNHSVFAKQHDDLKPKYYDHLSYHRKRLRPNDVSLLQVGPDCEYSVNCSMVEESSGPITNESGMKPVIFATAVSRIIRNIRTVWYSVLPEEGNFLGLTDSDTVRKYRVALHAYVYANDCPSKRILWRDVIQN